MAATTTLVLNKPYGMLSRFTADGSDNRTLADIAPRLPKDVWPIGRLDADSEGMLVLSSDKALVERLLAPRERHPRTYWAQVERVPDDDALDRLARGVVLDGERTLPARASRLDVEEGFAPWPRDPPIRARKSVPTAWIALTLVEGKNRQVRRMTAAVGHPTLRLIRVQTGALALLDVAPTSSSWRALDTGELERLLHRG